MRNLRLLTVFLLLCTLLSPLQAANWTTRGGSSERNQVSSESLAAADVSQVRWQVETGATGSQPIYVNGMIYHLAGDKLWEITPGGQAKPILANLGYLSDGSFRPSTSGLTYAEINGQPFLYFGTGDNRLCAFALSRPAMRCHRLHPENTRPTPANELPVVSVPLVMTKQVDGHEIDFAVMGDKQGRVWVVQGLADMSRPYAVTKVDVGGWILTSMVQIGNELAFVWGSSERRLGAYRIVPSRSGTPIDLTPAWSEVVSTPGEVDDGFAKVREAGTEVAYAIDSLGHLQKIQTATGTTFTLTLPGVKFTNTSPAIDDRHIYLSIRESTTGKGALVAVDRASFTYDPAHGKGWIQYLDHPANTNPLVLTSDANAVLVGDTRGNLYAFNRFTGQPTPFAQGQASSPLYRHFLPTPLDQVGESYQTLTGLTEPIIASDPSGTPLLITGISGAKDGKPTGYLIAYQTKRAFDVGWVEQELPLSGTAHATLNPGPFAQVTVTAQVYFLPDGGAPEPLPTEPALITLQTDKPTAITYTPPNDGRPGRLIGLLNAHDLIANGNETAQQLLLPATPISSQAERQATAASLPAAPEGTEGPLDLANNVIEGALRAIPDLAVTLKAPNQVSCGGGMEFVRATFSNAVSAAVRAKVLVQMSWSGGSRELLKGELLLQPGANAKELPLLTPGCDERISITAEVSHLPGLVEADLRNNLASISVEVTGAPQAEVREKQVIMVPADCQVNPDWSSNQPCLNYPGLIVGP